jgi:hypothetical protein
MGWQDPFIPQAKGELSKLMPTLCALESVLDLHGCVIQNFPAFWMIGTI